MFVVNPQGILVQTGQCHRILFLFPFQSNNMTLQSIASSMVDMTTGDASLVPHVIISNLEHFSIDLAAKKLEELGRIGTTVHMPKLIRP